jgi:hypothetical protein
MFFPPFVFVPRSSATGRSGRKRLRSSYQDGKLGWSVAACQPHHLRAASYHDRAGTRRNDRRRARHGVAQHPTEQHLLPLLIALGAAGEAARATRLHSGTTCDPQRMDADAFA